MVRAPYIAALVALGGGTLSAAPADARPPAHALRPSIGFTSYLDVGLPVAISGNKFMFGASYLIETEGGLEWAFGLHLGSGGQTLLVRPSAELHYRFDLGGGLEPWVGGGLTARIASPADQSFNFGLTARIVGGLDYAFTDWFGISASMALPDLGVRVIPSVVTIGTIEIDLGTRFSF